MCAEWLAEDPSRRRASPAPRVLAIAGQHFYVIPIPGRPLLLSFSFLTF